MLNIFIITCDVFQDSLINKKLYNIHYYSKVCVQYVFVFFILEKKYFYSARMC